MPRPYLGPKLWLDQKRGTWTIVDGRKKVRTGYPEHQRDLAVIAIHQYSNGTYQPDRPKGPTPARKAEARRGVYVAGFGPYVKIGITVNVEERLINLQTPEPMQLYALIDGWLSEEIALHKRFAGQRLNGEWFRNEGALADWIAVGCPPYERDLGSSADHTEATP